MKAIGNSPLDQPVLRLEQAKSFAFGIWLTDSQELPWDITGNQGKLTVSEAGIGGIPLDPPQLCFELQAVLDAPEAGYCRFDIQAAQLNRTPGSYPYVVTLLDPDGYSAVIV